MSLMLHVDASDIDNIWTTFQSSGVHTGVPSDGSAIEIWDDEGDGVTNVVLRGSGAAAPSWRSTTPLLLLPCIDFDGTNSQYTANVQNGSSSRPLSTFITAAACTVIISFYAESITNTNVSYAAHALIADGGGYWGIFLKNVSGQRKAVFYNYDGSEDIVEANISENTRHVVMARHDAGNLYISMNGAAEIGPVASGNTTVLTNNMYLAFGGLGVRYNGRMGEVKIWNTGNADGNLATEIASFMSKWVSAPAIPLLYTKMLLGVGR